MTEEVIALRALPENSSDADLLREMIGFAAHRLNRRQDRIARKNKSMRKPAS
jgi:hypothetical protein